MRESCLGEYFTVEIEVLPIKRIEAFQIDLRAWQHIREIGEVNGAVRHLKGSCHPGVHIFGSGLGFLRLASGTEAQIIHFVLDLSLREVNVVQVVLSFYTAVLFFW